MVRSPDLRDRQLSEGIAGFIRGERGHDIGHVVDRLAPLGEVGIFGGMPRDFARAGIDSFDSDVDLVVQAPAAALDDALRSMGGVRNRFGGYRVTYGRFDFDIWALENTWAVSAGHVSAHSLRDLVKTTFFECDAVLYHCSTSEISRSDSFWSNLEEGVVDINLQANPHEIGALVRTLRVVYEWKQELSPRLAEYLTIGLAAHRAAVVRYAQTHGRHYRFTHEIDLELELSDLRCISTKCASKVQYNKIHRLDCADEE